MSHNSSFVQWFSRSSRGKRPWSSRSFRPRLEQLESRWVPSTIDLLAGTATGGERCARSATWIVCTSATVFPHVSLVHGSSPAALASFLAFPGFIRRVTVAAGDVNGDHVDDIIVGTATGFSQVKAFNGASA